MRRACVFALAMVAASSQAVGAVENVTSSFLVQMRIDTPYADLAPEQVSTFNDLVASTVKNTLVLPPFVATDVLSARLVGMYAIEGSTHQAQIQVSTASASAGTLVDTIMVSTAFYQTMIASLNDQLASSGQFNSVPLNAAYVGSELATMTEVHVMMDLKLSEQHADLSAAQMSVFTDAFESAVALALATVPFSFTDVFEVNMLSFGAETTKTVHPHRARYEILVGSTDEAILVTAAVSKVSYTDSLITKLNKNLRDSRVFIPDLLVGYDLTSAVEVVGPDTSPLPSPSPSPAARTELHMTMDLKLSWEYSNMSTSQLSNFTDAFVSAVTTTLAAEPFSFNHIWEVNMISFGVVNSKTSYPHRIRYEIQVTSIEEAVLVNAAVTTDSYRFQTILQLNINLHTSGMFNPSLIVAYDATTTVEVVGPDSSPSPSPAAEAQTERTELHMTMDLKLSWEYSDMSTSQLSYFTDAFASTVTTTLAAEPFSLTNISGVNIISFGAVNSKTIYPHRIRYEIQVTSTQEAGLVAAAVITQAYSNTMVVRLSQKLHASGVFQSQIANETAGNLPDLIVGFDATTTVDVIGPDSSFSASPSPSPSTEHTTELHMTMDLKLSQEHLELSASQLSAFTGAFVSAVATTLSDFPFSFTHILEVNMISFGAVDIKTVHPHRVTYEILVTSTDESKLVKTAVGTVPYFNSLIDRLNRNLRDSGVFDPHLEVGYDVTSTVDVFGPDTSFSASPSPTPSNGRCGNVRPDDVAGSELSCTERAASPGACASALIGPNTGFCDFACGRCTMSVLHATVTVSMSRPLVALEPSQLDTFRARFTSAVASVISASPFDVTAIYAISITGTAAVENELSINRERISFDLSLPSAEEALQAKQMLQTTTFAQVFTVRLNQYLAASGMFVPDLTTDYSTTVNALGPLTEIHASMTIVMNQVYEGMSVTQQAFLQEAFAQGATHALANLTVRNVVGSSTIAFNVLDSGSSTILHVTYEILIDGLYTEAAQMAPTLATPAYATQVVAQLNSRANDVTSMWTTAAPHFTFSDDPAPGYIYIGADSSLSPSPYPSPSVSRTEAMHTVTVYFHYIFMGMSQEAFNSTGSSVLTDAIVGIITAIDAADVVVRGNSDAQGAVSVYGFVQLPEGLPVPDAEHALEDEAALMAQLNTAYAARQIQNPVTSIVVNTVGATGSQSQAPSVSVSPTVSTSSPPGPSQGGSADEGESSVSAASVGVILAGAIGGGAGIAALIFFKRRGPSKKDLQRTIESGHDKVHRARVKAKGYTVDDDDEL